MPNREKIAHKSRGFENKIKNTPSIDTENDMVPIFDPVKKPNPNIDYLKIPIIKDSDILEKISKNPPKVIKKEENKINEKGIMYYIKNEITNKRYIGQTTLSIDERLKGHFKSAKYNTDTRYINNTIRKYGRENFTIHEFHTIENEKQWKLDKLETHYIEKYHTTDPKYGYNIDPGGRGGKHSKLTKAKIAQSHIGMITSEKTKKLLSEINTGEKHPFFGKKHPESTLKKMSDDKIGDKNPFHGKHHTDASKKLMSAANKGIPNTQEQKRKISETKIQNFKNAYPIDEIAFRNAVARGASSKEIAEEFNLHRSAIHTWLGHLFNTSKIVEAREIANNSEN